MDRLDASVLRILEAKARRGILSAAVPAEPDQTALNGPEHRALALEVARKAVTLQRDTRGLLPLQASQRVLVVVPDAPTRSYAQDDQLASSLLEAVRQFAPAATEASDSADVIVLGTFDLAQSPDQQTLARSLAATASQSSASACAAPTTPRAYPPSAPGSPSTATAPSTSRPPPKRSSASSRPRATLRRNAAASLAPIETPPLAQTLVSSEGRTFSLAQRQSVIPLCSETERAKRCGQPDSRIVG